MQCNSLIKIFKQMFKFLSWFRRLHLFCYSTNSAVSFARIPGHSTNNTVIWTTYAVKTAPVFKKNFFTKFLLPSRGHSFWSANLHGQPGSTEYFSMKHRFLGLNPGNRWLNGWLPFTTQSSVHRLTTHQSKRCPGGVQILPVLIFGRVNFRCKSAVRAVGAASVRARNAGR